MRFKTPFAFVVLPSPWIDTADAAWLDVLRGNELATTVNFAYFSTRLRENKALPANQVNLDNFKRFAKQRADFGGLTAYQIEIAYRDQGVRTWGAYDFWFRTERIYQSIEREDGRPRGGWTTSENWGPASDGAYLFAGLWSSFAACNIMAMLMDGPGTVFVLGEQQSERYCDDVLPLPQAWYDMRAEHRRTLSRGAAGESWAYLERCARERTGTQIVHVGRGPIKSVLHVTERRVLREFEHAGN